MGRELAIADFNYHLPEHRIAKYPLAERDQSKLLVYKNGAISNDSFENLPDYISKDDLMVFNNTRVIRARVEMEKETGARIEIFCLEPHKPVEYQLSFSQTESCQWKCLIGNQKKWKAGVLHKEITVDGKQIAFSAEKLNATDNYAVIRFGWTGGLDFGSVLDSFGQTPIPPYLNRKAEAIDEIRYQTVYSKHKGSVAAPTAGLHFSKRVLERLTEKGVCMEEVTLHVGAGTFRPVQHHDALQHEMHVEFFSVHIDLLRKILANTGRLTAVGTTSMRALESVYWLAVKQMQQAYDLRHSELKQWEACQLPQDIPLQEAISLLIAKMEAAGLQCLQASTQIMIVPSYTFRVCRRLITNFHQPQSTLLLLVGAFVGDKWKDIYNYAFENGFRFLSYGDSSLLEN
ncbi:MAG: S-adenosylmethionine:tRNA ribosyltransferase-isomerase [Bacteroidales bacterium]|jgi:S-adenosylmethionine:tRNA ribosyltransferase-isomerase|nr:S-adenosylmethionine:tRNA ribosyltransferase-isomerase [Bacteroidales bacterium]